jgi:hypothetical protein
VQLVETAVRTSGNRRQSFQVLYGPRGVGKTVLLDRYAAIAMERKWAVVRHEARSPGDPIGAIVEQLHGCAGLTKKLSRELVELRERWGEESQTLNLGVYRRESKRQRRDASTSTPPLVASTTSAASVGSPTARVSLSDAPLTASSCNRRCQVIQP